MKTHLDWVAHASRVAAIASSQSRTLVLTSFSSLRLSVEKGRFGETPKPTRETRALPGFAVTLLS